MQSEPETSIVYLTSNSGCHTFESVEPSPSHELQKKMTCLVIINVGAPEGARAAVADLAATGITDCVQMGVEVGAGRDCRCRIISGTDVLLYRVLVEYRSPSV